MFRNLEALTTSIVAAWKVNLIIIVPLIEAKSGCNCIVITECKQLNELAQAQKFDELKSKHKSCGFDRKIPKFCCPPALFNEETTTEDPIEVTGRIKIEADVDL